jgi:hypothetical protein
MTRWHSVIGAVAGLLCLAGCTELPQTSAPEVVGSQGLAAPIQPANPPKLGETPLLLVSDFLAANAESDPNHASARQYLTASESTRWTDDRVTLVGNYHVSPTDRTDTVRVDAPVLGTVDPTGAYTPVLTGDGTGRSQEFKFQTEQVKVPKYQGPQWRIDKLLPGLIVTPTGFQQQFQQRSIYFYDAAETRLVPDARYTSLVDPTSLANWLLRTLAAGPRDALSAAESTELPQQTDPRRVSVELQSESNAPAKIAIPGSGQLNRQTRSKLAVQVAATLAQVAQIGTARPLTIYDGDKKVSIPGLGTAFSASDVAFRPSTKVPDLYYVDDGGGVVAENGQPLPGRVGNGYYDLDSVALTTGSDTDGLLIAGTRGNGTSKTLDIGSEATALKPVPDVTGALSRPAWAPDLPEVWIGAGSSLYRVTAKRTAQRVPMSTTNGPAKGQVLAVRLSPEGKRVAIVLKAPANAAPSSQVYVGNIVRGGDTVQVAGLTPVTPEGIMVTDVAWNDGLKLYAIGHTADGGDPGYYEFQCDGSRWSARGFSNLSGEPDSITVASGHVLAVSAAGRIWKQSGGTWQSPQGDETRGTAPVYVE